MSGDRKPLVQIATLWERTSKAGNTYYSGFLGDAQLLTFRGEAITPDNGEVVQTWKLLVQERDRRQQRQDQPVRGRATWRATELPEGRTTVHKNEPRRDPRQEYVNQLAAGFDERGPDEVPF